ncbi:Uncharacterized protein QTN25_005214 [Entamoeba marina]
MDSPQRSVVYDSQESSTFVDVDYPFELIIAIQMHFNEKLAVETIQECLKKNNNDLFLSLRDLNSTVTDTVSSKV